jgi:hypothetical protein
MALKPLNSPGGFSVGEITTGAINVISSTGNITTGNITGTNNGNVNLVGNLILSTGSNLSAGNLTASGNVTGAYILGNGAFLTGLPEAYGNANVANYLPTYTGNIGAGNVSATGNVSGNLLLGNGYFVTGIQYSNIAGAYGDSNVSSYLGSNAAVTILTTGNITTSANIAGNYILGNGAFLTDINASNIIGSYGNANVKAYLESGDTINANFGGGTVTTTGNITGGNVTTGGQVTATGNITGGNVTTGGQVTATGNITGGNLVSAANINGTNVNADTLTSSGALTLATGTNGNINIQPNGSGNVVLSNTFINSVAYPVQDQDAASKVYVDNLVSTAISYHDSVIAATTTDLATATGGTITYNQPNGVGNGVGATLTTTGSFDLIDSANVQSANARILVKNESNGAFNGIYVWSNATAITRADNEDTAGVGNAFSLGLNDYFFVTNGNVNLGTAWIVDAPNSAIVFGSSNIQFAQFSQTQVYSANTSAGLTLVGQQFNAKTDNNTTAFDGGGNIIVKAGANLTTPNIGNATGSSLNVTDTLTGGNIVTGGTVTATGNVSGGNLSGTLITGTLTTAAQPNITSVGTLTTLDVTGNITSLSGNISGNYLLGNGAFITGLPAGYSNADVANYLASNANVAILTTGNITTSANAVASFFIGDGSLLSNINAGNIAGSYGNAQVAAYLASSPNINITLGNSNSNITTGGTIRTYGNAIANNFTANNALTLNGIEFNAVTIEAYTQQTSTTSLSNIASITVADLPADTSAIEVTLRGRDLTNTQAGKIVITWGGSNMDFTRYAEVIAGNGCGTPTVAYDGTTLTLQVTPVTSNLVTWNAKVVTV